MHANGRTDPTLEQLLRQAQNGDAGALGRLLEIHRDYLRRLAAVAIDRRLQGKLDASDMVQDTFLEAHRDFAQFHGGSEQEFLAWLRRILAANLANVVRHYLATRRRDVRRECGLGPDDTESGAEGDLAASGSSPSRQAARREDESRLSDALARLPKDYGEVLRLRHLQGLNFAETALRMGRSVDSVKNLWARALTRLRREFGTEP